MNLLCFLIALTNVVFAWCAGNTKVSSNLISNTQNQSPRPSYHHAHNLQLLQDKVHLLLRGEWGQDSIVAPAGQLSIVIWVLRSDELQAGVAHQMPAFTTYIF